MNSRTFQLFRMHWLRRLLGAVVFLLVFSGLNCKMEQPMAQGDYKPERKFVDKVQKFRTDGRTVKVLFQLHAAEYTVEADNTNFKEIMATLADGWQQQSDIHLVVVGNKIQAVGATP